MTNSFFSQLLSSICEPKVETTSDEIERKLQFKRNKSFLIANGLFALFIAFYIIFLKTNPTTAHYVVLASNLGIVLLFCILCRTYGFLFKTIYPVLLGLIGPMSIYFNPEGLYSAWITVFIFPPLVLYCSGSRFLYTAEMIIQLVLMNILYRPRLREIISTENPEIIAQKLTLATTLAVILNTVMMYSIELSLKNIYKNELVVVEAKTKELENQKCFVLSFSHEIRNLINNLTGNIQLCLLENIPQKVKDYLENAEIGASLLLQMINNILDSGNSEVQELEINPMPRPIHETLEKMWNICSYLLKTKDLKGQMMISNSLPKVMKIDHERLLQILINLAGTAVKFTHKGVVSIKIEWNNESSIITEESFNPNPFDYNNEGIFEKDQALSILDKDITIVGPNRKKWNSIKYCNESEDSCGILKISIIDTGYGVNSENLSKVFDRFSSQTFGANACDKLATNIGLFITKKLCNKMGGEIKVFSKLHRGTAFTICLPAQQIFHNPQSIPMSLPLFTAFANAKHLTAMVVDDLNFNIIILSNFLHKLGIDSSRIQTAKDGREAYYKYVDSVINGKPYDILTMDVEMPVMSGKESARKIREYEREKGLKPCLLIMVSGNCCESEIRECLLGKDGKALADYFLKKPATFDDIFNLISKHYS